jgi:signal transduction histidine kinase/CheY-like chemotaxis protein
MNDGDSRSLQVYMSRVYPETGETDSSEAGVPVVRAAVPLVRLVEGQWVFRGVLAISLNFDQAVRNLTSNPRHVVFLGENNSSVSDGDGIQVRTIFDPKYKSIKEFLALAPQQATTQGMSPPEKTSPSTANAPEEFSQRILSSFASGDKAFAENLRTAFDNQIELRQAGASREPVAPLEEFGRRFPADSISGGRIQLVDDRQFFLMKLNVPDPVKYDIRQLNLVLNRLREFGGNLRYPPTLSPSNADQISISSTDEGELQSAVAKLKEEFKLTNRYRRPVRCSDIAAHGYRIYFDPSNSERFLTLFVGFSSEELTEDLYKSAEIQWQSTVLAVICGGTLNLILLHYFITSPIRRLKTATEKLAMGEFETSLPAYRIDDEIGRLSRTFSMMVREVKERDTEIRRQNEQLDEKVKEQTLSLLEKASSLAEARDQLQKAVIARDVFLTKVSHDLRTPLNHIFGYAALLGMTELDEEQRSDLEKLQGSSRHLLRLIEDILAYQKIIMGQLPLNPVSFDIQKFLASIRESNEPVAAVRQNILELRMNDVAAMVYNDDTRLRQILDNLISNACKFTTNGVIRIDVQTENECIRIGVKDSGIGISESGLAKLFQPFGKISDTNLNPDGTGLGLVISRELARLMGGDLTVSSVVGEGSTFHVTFLRNLPTTKRDGERFVVESDSSGAIAEPSFPKVESNLLERHTSNQVLVIDDDPHVRELICRFLAEAGLKVLTAASAVEGIELAVRLKPSVITLDLMMPEIDGWSVLGALKANAQTAEIPVVLVTVLDDPQKGYSLGAADYVSKPIEGDRLKQVVRRYCGQEAPSVLIIDDNPADREIVRRILQNDGCRILEAADGKEGLNTLDASPVDLIVLDLIMPGMDGFEFLEELRKKGKAELPAIIVLTGKDLAATSRDRLSGMVSDVIQKSQFDHTRFLQEINRHLDNARTSS